MSDLAALNEFDDNDMLWNIKNINQLKRWVLLEILNFKIVNKLMINEILESKNILLCEEWKRIKNLTQCFKY